MNESTIGFTEDDLEEINNPTFDQISAACADCEDVILNNAVPIMKEVMVGDIKPERYWCDEHVEEFQRRTAKWAQEHNRPVPIGHEWHDKHENDKLTFFCRSCAVQIAVTAADPQAGIQLYCPNCYGEMGHDE